jgi:hypothetical protein
LNHARRDHRDIGVAADGVDRALHLDGGAAAASGREVEARGSSVEESFLVGEVVGREQKAADVEDCVFADEQAGWTVNQI